MSIFTIPIVIVAILTNITAFRRLMDAKKAILAKNNTGRQ
jgi:CDP-diacylglycerol--glycerol-3-phosphate 3-phosphatidyltransferase